MPACVCAACVLVPVQELATRQQGGCEKGFSPRGAAVTGPGTGSARGGGSLGTSGTSGTGTPLEQDSISGTPLEQDSISGTPLEQGLQSFDDFTLL